MPKDPADSFYSDERNCEEVHVRVEVFFLLAHDPTEAKAGENDGSELRFNEKQRDHSGSGRTRM
jgi:hypothetical protein